MTPELCFRYIMTTLNVNEIPQFPELIASLGERRLLGEGSYIEFIGLLEHERIAQYIAEAPAEIVSITNKRGEEVGIPISWCHPSHGEKPLITECVAWTEPFIIMGGYVMPCCGVLQTENRDFLKKHAFGNVLEKPFKDIWYSEEYKRFRQMVPRAKGELPMMCRDCRLYDKNGRQVASGADSEKS